MRSETLDKLLCSLEIRPDVMALCEVNRGERLVLPPMGKIPVHYIPGGAGMLRMSDGSVTGFGPGGLVFVPRDCGHGLAETGDEQEAHLWSEGAAPLGDGMMRFALPEGTATIVTACGTISADCGGLDLFEHFRKPVSEDVSAEPYIGSAFKLMLHELEAPRFGTRSLCEALMKHACEQLRRNRRRNQT